MVVRAGVRKRTRTHIHTLPQTRSLLYIYIIIIYYILLYITIYYILYIAILLYIIYSFGALHLLCRIHCEDKNTFLQDCEDDGETAAGGRLLHLLQVRVCVCGCIYCTSNAIQLIAYASEVQLSSLKYEQFRKVFLKDLMMLPITTLFRQCFLSCF